LVIDSYQTGRLARPVRKKAPPTRGKTDPFHACIVDVGKANLNEKRGVAASECDGDVDVPGFVGKLIVGGLNQSHKYSIASIGKTLKRVVQSQLYHSQVICFVPWVWLLLCATRPPPNSPSKLFYSFSHSKSYVSNLLYDAA
jgi:hypothetical protein